MTHADSKLADQIADRLTAAITMCQRSETEKPAAALGLAYGGPDQPVIGLTIADVARIAAQAAEEHFSTEARAGFMDGYIAATERP